MGTMKRRRRERARKKVATMKKRGMTKKRIERSICFPIRARVFVTSEEWLDHDGCMVTGVTVCNDICCCITFIFSFLHLQRLHIYSSSIYDGLWRKNKYL